MLACPWRDGGVEGVCKPGGPAREGGITRAGPARRYFVKITFGGIMGSAGSKRPKEKMAEAEAMATYCFPPAS